MAKKVHVRQYTRRKPDDFGSLARFVPPGTKARPSIERDPVTGKFVEADKKETPWETAERFLEKYTKAFKGDTIGAMYRAKEEANRLDLEEVAEALEGMEDDDHAEPRAWFTYSDDEEPRTIGKYYDDTEGEFVVTWHATDAWRGYYEVEAADPKKWTKVHQDASLAMSEDSANLGRFDALVKAAMKQAGIRYVRADSVSSNIFSSGYDLFVEADQAERVESLINILAPVFRDPRQFTATALTGKDPRELTESDVAFINVAAISMSKEPEENKREMIREALERAGMDPGLADKLGRI